MSRADLIATLAATRAAIYEYEMTMVRPQWESDDHEPPQALVDHDICLAETDRAIELAESLLRGFSL